MNEPEVIVSELTDEELMTRLVPKEDVQEPEKKEEPAPSEEKQDETPPNNTEVPDESKIVNEEKPPEPPAEEEVKITKAEYDKLIKRIEDKEKFIQRQAQEVGARRKSEEQLQAEIFQLQQALQAKWQTEPLEAHNIQNQIRERETELKEAETRTIQERNQTVVKNFVREPETLFDDMVELLKEDGNDADSIRRFRDNPYWENPGTLINLAKRAELTRTIKGKDTEIASLKAEIQTLKGKPQETVKKIEKALKEPSAMNNASGQANAVKHEVDATQIVGMSDKELEQALKERLANTS